MYFLVFIIGFLFSGLWFGNLLFIRNILFKKDLSFLDKYSPLLSSIVPTIIICFIFKKHPFHFVAEFNFKLWLIALVTVVVTSLIILGNKKGKESVSDALGAKCIEASMMEIPQRVMMQTLCCELLNIFKCNVVYGIMINGFIWCADIVIQALIFKQRLNKDLIIELLASFVFSMGIGYVFYQSSCLLIPMLSHACERYLTHKEYTN